MLCTANQCRSPMAEHFLRHHLARRGAAQEMRLRSAGFVVGGAQATASARAAMRRRQLPLDDHVSTLTTTHLLNAADLIVTMTREHACQAVLLAPDVLARVFPLRQLVRRGEAVGRRWRGQPLDDWLARVARGRESQDLLGTSRLDDIADPTGLSARLYEAHVGELDDLTNRLADLLAAQTAIDDGPDPLSHHGASRHQALPPWAPSAWPPGSVSSSRTSP